MKGLNFSSSAILVVRLHVSVLNQHLNNGVIRSDSLLTRTTVWSRSSAPQLTLVGGHDLEVLAFLFWLTSATSSWIWHPSSTFNAIVGDCGWKPVGFFPPLPWEAWQKCYGPWASGWICCICLVCGQHWWMSSLQHQGLDSILTENPNTLRSLNATFTRILKGKLRVEPEVWQLTGSSLLFLMRLEILMFQMQKDITEQWIKSAIHSLSVLKTPLKTMKGYCLEQRPTTRTIFLLFSGLPNFWG